jgi:hypothetical protein
MNRPAAYHLLLNELASLQQIDYDQLASTIGGRTSRIVQGADGVAYAIEHSVKWGDAGSGQLIVSATVTPADWGAPHDELEDSIVIARTQR